eukprot:5868775-Pyramimonas_sp.AAC.1
MLPWRMGISKDKEHTVILYAISKRPLELPSRINLDSLWYAKHSCPCAYKCVPCHLRCLPCPRKSS